MKWSCRNCTVALAIVLIGLAGCANKATAPITQGPAVKREGAIVHRQGQPVAEQRQQRPREYIVQRGDTLHSIAWRFRLDYRQVAKWNRLANPDVIYAGQRLRLYEPVVSNAASQPQIRPQTRPQSQPQPRPRSPAAPPPARVPATPPPTTVARAPAAEARITGGVSWVWPASGDVRPAQSALGTEAIEILGQRGDPVRAAAAGTVVYAGSGLRGYGRLIIVKHSEEYLSAYAHNERLLAAEGTRVASGEQIAEMGDSDAKRVMLHFEIRRDGKAVGPLKLLPRR